MALVVMLYVNVMRGFFKKSIYFVELFDSCLLIISKQLFYITMTKQRIRLSEATLHKIIRKCVNEAVNEISDQTKMAAAYKSYPGAYGKYNSFRKEVQHNNFEDIASDIYDNPNHPYMKKLMKRIENEYPDLEGMSYDYFEMDELADQISDEYQIPHKAAHRALLYLLGK